jgi:hypothetical protein
MTLQRLGLLAAPMQHALIEHAHGIDDLRVAGERLGMGVGPGGMRAALGEQPRGRPLVDCGDGHQHEARRQHQPAEIGVDQEDHREVERRDRRVEQQQHGRTGDERAHLMQAAQGLRIAALPGRGSRDDAGEDRRAEDGLHGHGQATEDLPPQHVED